MCNKSIDKVSPPNKGAGVRSELPPPLLSSKCKIKSIDNTGGGNINRGIFGEVQAVLIPKEFDYGSWLGERFPEVGAPAFYRDLFPVGSLQKDRDKVVKGEYPAIAIQVKDDRNLRHTVTDDLSVIDQLIKTDDFCIMSPVSYAGSSQRKKMAHALYALVIDLDFLKVKKGQPTGIETLFYYIDDLQEFPRPTYIVASGTGLHLYFMLDKPLILYPNVMDSVAAYRKKITREIWTQYITEKFLEVEYEGVTQGFRMVGTITKRGTRVRAFLTGDKLSIEELNAFVPEASQIVSGKASTSTYTLDEASVLFPKWKERRIDKGLPRNTYLLNPAVYHWWKRRVAAEGSVGSRYWCIVALASYAAKCGIPRGELERDAEELRKILDSRGRANAFTEKDVECALTAYRPGMVTYPIDDIVEKTNIPIKKNTRHGNKQYDWMQADVVNVWVSNELKERPNPCKINREFVLSRMRSNGEIHGRPVGSGTKQEQIQAWRKAHPDGRKIDCQRETGISRPTILKWWDA